MPQSEVHISCSWFHLCYGDEVTAQEDTLDSINPKQLSVNNTEHFTFEKFPLQLV